MKMNIKHLSKENLNMFAETVPCPKCGNLCQLPKGVIEVVPDTLACSEKNICKRRTHGK